MKRYASFVRSVWRNARGETDLPRFLTYVVTFACNARCVMCDSWKKPSENDLGTDEIARIFQDLPEMDAVRLTGGEPFVRKDLPEIAALAQRYLKPRLLHVTTNGFLPRRIIRFCERRDKSVPLHLLVSVDGVGEVHNRVRGHKLAWDRAMSTLKALAPRRRELGLTLAVNQTIVDAQSAVEYGKVRDALRPLGIHNQAVMAYDGSATYSTVPELSVAPGYAGAFSPFGQFSSQQLEGLFDEIARDLKRMPLGTRVAKRYYLDGIRSRLLRGEAHINPKCVALSAHLRLFPDGHVPTCQFNSTPAGNLRTQSFREVWESSLKQQQRQWVTQCPGCWAECEVLPSAIYTGDLFMQTVKRAMGRAPRLPGAKSANGFAVSRTRV